MRNIEDQSDRNFTKKRETCIWHASSDHHRNRNRTAYSSSATRELRNSNHHCTLPYLLFGRSELSGYDLRILLPLSLERDGNRDKDFWRTRSRGSTGHSPVEPMSVLLCENARSDSLDSSSTSSVWSSESRPRPEFHASSGLRRERGPPRDGLLASGPSIFFLLFRKAF